MTKPSILDCVDSTTQPEILADIAVISNLITREEVNALNTEDLNKKAFILLEVAQKAYTRLFSNIKSIESASLALLAFAQNPNLCMQKHKEQLHEMIADLAESSQKELMLFDSCTHDAYLMKLAHLQAQKAK